VIEPLVGKTGRLVGIGAPSPEGKLFKMSKSLNNAIYLSDDPDTVSKKVMSMYTDPNRLKATDPGTVENNPLWIFHDTFNADKKWISDAKMHYRAGKIGDVACKKQLVEVLNEFLKPIQLKRKQYQADLAYLMSVLREGAEKANTIAEKTLLAAKEKIDFNFS
jgi:tryptophanyl-tRNA synthetase